MASNEISNGKKVACIATYVLGLAMEVPLVAVMIGSIMQNAPIASELVGLFATILAGGGVAVGLKGIVMISNHSNPKSYSTK